MPHEESNKFWPLSFHPPHQNIVGETAHPAQGHQKAVVPWDLLGFKLAAIS